MQPSAAGLLQVCFELAILVAVPDIGNTVLVDVAKIKMASVILAAEQGRAIAGHNKAIVVEDAGRVDHQFYLLLSVPKR